jgi:hypothetical protein
VCVHVCGGGGEVWACRLNPVVNRLRCTALVYTTVLIQADGRDPVFLHGPTALNGFHFSLYIGLIP